MQPDPLFALICHGDGVVAAPRAAPDLGARVRRAARRRGRWRAGTATALACLICAVSAVLALRSRPRFPGPGSLVVSAEKVEQLRLEVAALDADAALHERTARRIQELRARDHHQPRRSLRVWNDPAAPDRLAEARNRAALILVRAAERAAGHSSSSAEAREMYEQAARLFPDTPAGRQAARRVEIQYPTA